MAKENKETRIVRKDGKNCFVEVVNEAFDKDRVRLDFISYDTTKSSGDRITASVSIYISFEEWRRFSKKLLEGAKEYKKYCDAHQDYKEPLYKTMGGTSAKRLKEWNKSRSDGKSLSRQFQVTSSKKGLFFTAMSGPGEENETGLIVPKYTLTTAENKVSIPMEFDTAYELVLAVDSEVQAYVTAKYVARMLSGNSAAENKKDSERGNY